MHISLQSLLLPGRILTILLSNIYLTTANPQQQQQPTSTIIITQPPSTVIVVLTTATTLPASSSSTVTISSSSPPSPQYTNSLTLKTSVLNSTNLFRYEHNATFLSWNDSLASYASSYVAKCIWAHSHGAPGENLARGYPSMTGSIDAWGDERELYDFQGSQTGFTEATGHFTQLVWKATRSVGCAALDCNGTNGVDGWMVVCEYWPAGNVVVDGANGDVNRYFEANVQARINSGAGFSEASATAGVDGVASTTATDGSATSTLRSGGTPAAGNGDGFEAGLALSLTVLVVYVCAFM